MFILYIFICFVFSAKESVAVIGHHTLSIKNIGGKSNFFIRSSSAYDKMSVFLPCDLMGQKHNRGHPITYFGARFPDVRESGGQALLIVVIFLARISRITRFLVWKAWYMQELCGNFGVEVAICESIDI
jgi:hypothetical protein